MKIYLSHSTSYDYENELYAPLKQLSLNEVEIYFPHDMNKDGINSKDIISSSDLVLAEISYPSTGQGIELGWANSDGIPIICIYRVGSSFPNAIKAVCDEFIDYRSSEDLIGKLESRLSRSI